MDSNEFDNLVKRLGGTASRRAAIAGMLAGVLGATRIGQAAAKRKGRGGDVDAAACGNQGCLSGGVVCLSGFGVDAACGSGGNTCIACAGATPRCAPNTDFTGGSCQAALPCNASQCQLAGACVQLTDSRVCGRFANGTCQQACGAAEVCTSPTSSGVPFIARTCVQNSCPATCTTGCCSGLTCVTTPSVGACGDNGATCVNCIDRCGLTDNGCAIDPADGVRKCRCDFQEEPPPVEECGPANCPNGCCRNNVCQPGTAKDACGTGGATCATCAGKKKCNANSRTCKKRR